MIPFSMWPIGYPTLIAIVSLVSGLNVFWSSKLLGIVLIALIIHLLYRLTNESIDLYATCILLTPVTRTIHFTWSEAPFITSLTALLYFSVKYVNKPSFFHLFGITISCILAFLMRYIGIFTIPYLAVFAIYFFIKKSYKQSFELFIATAIIFTFTQLYFMWNRIYSGHTTGIPRIDAPETVLENTIQLFKGLIQSINPIYNGPISNTLEGSIFIVSIIILFCVILWLKPHIKSPVTILYQDPLFNLSLLLAVGYFCTIILSRFFYHFDSFTTRILFPALFFLWISVMRMFDQLISESEKNYLRKGLIFILIASIGYQIASMLYRVSINQIYLKIVETELQRYNSVPNFSLVAHMSPIIIYQRPDLVVSWTYCKIRPETISKYLARVKSPNGKIYLDTKYLPPGCPEFDKIKQSSNNALINISEINSGLNN